MGRKETTTQTTVWGGLPACPMVASFILGPSGVSVISLSYRPQRPEFSALRISFFLSFFNVYFLVVLGLCCCERAFL